VIRAPDYPIHTLEHARQSLLLLEHRHAAGYVDDQDYVLIKQRIEDAIARLQEQNHDQRRPPTDQE
jgi:hypothetical protein